jgi:hypothetical protein
LEIVTGKKITLSAGTHCQSHGHAESKGGEDGLWAPDVSHNTKSREHVVRGRGCRRADPAGSGQKKVELGLLMERWALRSMWAASEVSTQK